MKKKYFYIIILFAICFVPNLYAANIYVDKTLGGNITNGSYSIATRDNSGSDGDAYTTVQAAINAMNPGDHILLRGGTYQDGHIDIPLSKNGTSWTEGKYNKISSYLGEWAILDGQGACDGAHGEVIGYMNYDHSSNHDLKYWWFERLEITGGGSSDGTMGAGFIGAGGPFKFRYCYIHDNLATDGGANPGGLKGHHWHDSVVEFCYFDNNGMASGHNFNCAHILIYSDYNYMDIAQNGFDDNDQYRRPVARNVIRYNYMTNGVVGYKHKSGQLFSGRNPAGGHAWDDTYNTYGDDIHHNIIENGRGHAFMVRQDFAQVHNNIIGNNQGIGIGVGYEPAYSLYKVVIYNNTILDTTDSQIIRYTGDMFGAYQPAEYYGWDLNNIIDKSSSSWGYFDSRGINVAITNSSGTKDDLSGHTLSHNYFYRPDISGLVMLRDQEYTKSGIESQSQTYLPRVVYENAYDSGDTLFEGTSGASQYIARGSHVLEGATTIANGGIGGVHPYLSGVSIPSYVGATNPNDHAWVDGVLGLSNLANLKNGVAGDPSWIEGSVGNSPPPPQPPSDFIHGE